MSRTQRLSDSVFVLPVGRGTLALRVLRRCAQEQALSNLSLYCLNRQSDTLSWYGITTLVVVRAPKR